MFKAAEILETFEKIPKNSKEVLKFVIKFKNFKKFLKFSEIPDIF
jgi:hypothetical protein